ncbi:diaminopimelate decarboxylase [Streptomyces sp. NPDC004752]
MTTDSQGAARRQRILSAAVRQRLLHPDDAMLTAFVDLDTLGASVAALHQAFPGPDRVLHTFAAKANSLVPVLEELRRYGMGCEVASPGELARALAAGFAPEQIVFDSPAKTRRELEEALDLGVAVNVDNFQELARIDDILATRASASRIGVRINPQVGSGSIAAMSTATVTSKFGIALEDAGNRDRLVAAYRDRPWLTWIHAHVGSQGCSLTLIAQGISKAVDFAEKINVELGRRQVVGIDIGGGLPVDFTTDAPCDFEDYVAELRAQSPALFSGRYEIVTEFGRSLLAKNGFMATYVEYTKAAGDRPIAVTHAGAQVAARTVFMPDSWPLRITAHTSVGAAKAGEPVVQDVAGPCCFAGDLLAQARPLPLLEPGDIVAVLDTGAYYFSTPFFYNDLPAPAVYGVRIDSGENVHFRLLRPAQTVDDLLREADPSRNPSAVAQPA